MTLLHVQQEGGIWPAVPNCHEWPCICVFDGSQCRAAKLRGGTLYYCTRLEGHHGRHWSHGQDWCWKDDSTPCPIIGRK